MRSRNPGRVAAMLYLLMGVPAAFSLMYVTPTLVVPGNPAATAANILASETLFRVAIVCDLMSGVAFVFLLLALYRLLAGVSRHLAATMVVLGAVGIAIVSLNVLNELAALTLLRRPDYLSVFGRPEIEALAFFFLRLQRAGLVIAQIFWGLWLLPLGLLMMRADGFPRWLGMFILINGVAYPLVSLTWLLVPPFANVASRLALVPELGEPCFVLWLLVRGAQVNTPKCSSPLTC